MSYTINYEGDSYEQLVAYVQALPEGYLVRFEHEHTVGGGHTTLVEGLLGPAQPRPSTQRVLLPTDDDGHEIPGAEPVELDITTVYGVLVY